MRRRTSLLTTPPTPKAGTILPMRARLQPNQSRRTTLSLSLQVAWPRGRLYRSKPSRCNGVLKSCMAAGARNWAVLARLMCFSSSAPKPGRRGAISGGRLKLAKTVMESRMAKRA